MHLVTAAILGAIQGLTEFLPVSSTAHLLIAERLIGFHDPNSVFTITIQFGSILAVMWLYRAKLLGVLRGLPSDRDAQRFALMISLAVVPAVIAGLQWGDTVKDVLHASPRVIAWAFIIGGFVMLAVERFRPAPVVNKADRTPNGRAIAGGACQAVAVVPGGSR